MPADVLRDKEIGIPAPPTAEAPKPTPAPTLAGYARVYQQEIEKLTPKYEAAEKAAREDLERRKQEIADYKQRVLSSPLAPAPPALPAEPVAPVIAARPFLDAGPGEPWQQSVQKLMMGMGLMAQMGIGIKGGFPGGAWAAYTGALNGWAEGDHIRAANEWKTYMGQLQQYDRSVGRVQQDFENAMRTWGHDQDRLKTEFGILAAEHGLSREGIEMAFKEPDRMMQQLTTSVKIMETMQRDADSLAFRNLMFLQTKERNDELARHNREVEAQKKLEATGQPGTTGGFTPEALDLATKLYLQTGKLPPMGLGKSGNASRTAIINRAGELAQEAPGGPEGQSTRMAVYNANKNELSAIQRQRGVVLAYARNFDRAVDLSLEMSEKTDRTGVPAFNKWVLAGKQATGDVDVAQFNAAALTTAVEYARVMSGGTISTDAARSEAQAILSPIQTKEQYRAVTEIMRRDTQNRIKGYDDQIEAVLKGMKATGADVPTEPLRAAPGGESKQVLKPMSQADYQAIKAAGYSDADILAKGYAVPR